MSTPSREFGELTPEQKQEKSEQWARMGREFGELTPKQEQEKAALWAQHPEVFSNKWTLERDPEMTLFAASYNLANPPESEDDLLDKFEEKLEREFGKFPVYVLGPNGERPISDRPERKFSTRYFQLKPMFAGDSEPEERPIYQEEEYKVDAILGRTGKLPPNVVAREQVKVDVVQQKLNPTAVWKADWSDAVLNGRLGEICQRRMNRFPIAYAWPSLIATASTMVPPIMPTTGIIISDDNVNSFAGLVGPVHSGKSQAIEWACKTLGLPDGSYSDVKAGSSESLLTKLSGMRTKGMLSQSLLIDLDEWSHLFAKAGIENSSFITFLHTAFYKRRQNVVMSRGKEIDFNCQISFIGGIVEDEFDDCFGVKSMGGLHDRFTFGLCPEGYNFLYRPFEGFRETTSPITVEVDPTIWEMVEQIRKENPKIGREAEIAVRAARICASFDGRKILRTQDCESSVKAFIETQLHVREYLRPNEGVTNDAKCANALLMWLERNASDMRVVPERDVRHGLRKTLAKLGPGTLAYATKNLVGQGMIWFGQTPNTKPYAGRIPCGYQLLNKQ